MFEVIEIGGMATVKAQQACNHVYVVDVSGSMYRDLPQVRQHLKNAITLVAQPNDTFSVIWFSGRGQCGTVFENLLVNDLTAVSAMHTAIDRWLTPRGLTGFVDPINLAMTLSLKPGNVNSFIMMTDGYDNQSRRDEILKRTAELRNVYQSVSFIEFGYYADREMIGKMAEAVNGLHLFADGVIDYQSVLESAIQGTARVNNIAVNVNKRAKHCIFNYKGQIRIVPVVDGVAEVPEDVGRVHSIVPKDVLGKQLSVEHLYMILYYAAKQEIDKLVWDTLQALGDVHLVNMYQNAFTKQELSEFFALVEKCVTDETARYQAGKSDNAVPNKNAKTIVDLLSYLSGVDDCQIITDSPYWEYNRTSRASVVADEDQVLPRFVPSKTANGFSLRGLVFNSSRPNISIGATVQGQVELPENDFGLKRVPSHIHRNYTVIKDGIKNMKHLPILMGVNAFDSIKTEYPHEVIEEGNGKVYVVFNLQLIPVINRGAVENVELSQLTSNIVNLEYLKAAQKVLNTLLDEQGGSKAKISGLSDQYGEDAAKWLSSIGVRDYGFSPVGTKSVEATDVYMSVELDYKLAGVSSLPSIAAVRKKIADNKKLNLADQMIADNLTLYTGMDEQRLEMTKTGVVVAKRLIEKHLALGTYSLILGRKWFGDDETIVHNVQVANQPTTLSLTKTRKEVKI